MLPVFHFQVTGYAFFATVGLCASVLFLYFRIDIMDLSFHEYLACLAGCAATGAIGARLLFVVSMLPQMEITVENLFYYLLNGGIVFYGGMFGVLLGLLIFSKIRKKDTATMLNVSATAIPLFHAFARLGCLFAGCCYGIPSKWGVIMQHSKDVVRFPVQLVESFCDLIIFLLICGKEKRTKNYENNLVIYLTCYAVCRFILEYFRGDEIRGIWPVGLSTAQLVSLLILAMCMVKFVMKAKKRREHDPESRDFPCIQPFSAGDEQG